MSRDHAHEHRLRFAGNFHVLLVILLITIFLESFAAESALIRELMRAGVLLTLLAALQVIARSSAVRSTGRGILAVLVALELARLIWSPGSSAPGESGIERFAVVLQLGTLAWLLILLAVSLLHMRRVNSRAISAALCGYLLIGLWFYLLYASLPADWFRPLPSAGKRDDLFYFSFVTLTSLGYGDVTPAEPVTRSLAILEVVIGQFYLAVLIARQVGLYLAGRLSSDDSEEFE
ncbi:MAG: hypothetical protein H6831_02395 [Planctomycetes bacterium]|nr:hypothetical protein [Planctomycetota bacterium]MCB9903232.1 hypothetical protein [Planctomycetota bacterium]